MNKFSIVTPTRNVFGKIQRCVGSVRAQTDVDYEHIVQDACSNDGSSEWLLAQSDLKVTVEKDRGMYDAINRGWEKSSGEILSWLNADEQYLPGTLRKVEIFFSKNPRLDFVFGDAIIVSADGTPISARRDVPLSHFYIRNTFLYSYSCTMFFRRRLFDEGVLRLDDGYRFAADMDLVLRLLDSGKLSARIADYLGVFMMDGTNLSCDPRMIDETEKIRVRHGAFKFKRLRLIANAGRFCERFLSGGLKSSAIDFLYALNEKPEYVRQHALSVPPTYET